MKTFFLFLSFLFGQVLRRNLFCRRGRHKYELQRETLALGETLIVPVCTIYGCGYRDTKGARLLRVNDGNDGTFIEMDHRSGRAFVIGRTTEKKFRKAVGGNAVLLPGDDQLNHLLK